MTEVKHVILREDSSFEFGQTFSRACETDEFQAGTKFMRSKSTPWFASDPLDILKNLGIPTESRRASDIDNLFSGKLSGYYYVEAASDGTDEAAKWILAALAQHLNEENLTFSHAHRLLPPDYLKSFVAYLKADQFARSFSREIFTSLLRGDQFEANEDGPMRRLEGDEVMDLIVRDPKYKAADGSEIDTIIASVVDANPDNALKVKDQPKLLQWFVGQVMKASKGKASAPVVLEKLQAHFGL